MFRLLLLFLAVGISLHALSSADILSRADGFMKTNNKSDQFRAYNDYKNLYLRSVVDEDDELRISSLKGIVQSGKKLHIDVSKYSDELSSLKSKSKVQTHIHKSEHDKSKSIKVQSSNKLESVKFKEDKLILEFDKPLNEKQVNYFTLYDTKKKQYRYIFDIHDSMLIKSKSLRKKNIKRIKIAQFTPTTLRLVIENNKKLEVEYSHDSEMLVIDIDGTGVSSSQKTIEKKYIPSRVDRNKVVVIDAGHGGKDPGAVGYKKYREKIIVMDISKQLKAILKSRGYKVHMTRDRDKFVKLSNRTQYANKKNADIFISIHANAVGGSSAKKVHGIECYFLSKSRSSRAKKVAAKENSADLSDMNFYGKESFLNTLNSHNIVASNKLAIDLQRGMLGSLKSSYKNVNDGGVREGPFWVLVGAQMPSVLVEVGFISHPTEAQRLVNPAYQKKLAYGLADGIERYFANNH